MKTLYFMVMLLTLSACSTDKEEAPAKDEVTGTQSSTATTDSSSVIPEQQISTTQKAASKKAEKEATDPAYDGIIFIETGSVQCQAQGVTHLETAQLLINNDIEVLESKCATLSGVSVIAQCGAAGLDINVHIVSPENHVRALSLGFKSTAGLKQEDTPGYIEKDCEEVARQYQ